jgi:hypothetical protein
MSDLTMMRAERLRKAMVMKYGTIDFGDFTEQLCAISMEEDHGLKSRTRRLEIQLE